MSKRKCATGYDDVLKDRVTQKMRMGQEDVQIISKQREPPDGSRLVYVYQYSSANGWDQIGKRELPPGYYVDICKGNVLTH